MGDTTIVIMEMHNEYAISEFVVRGFLLQVVSIIHICNISSYKIFETTVHCPVDLNILNSAPSSSGGRKLSQGFLV